MGIKKNDFKIGDRVSFSYGGIDGRGIITAITPSDPSNPEEFPGHISVIIMEANNPWRRAGDKEMFPHMGATFYLTLLSDEE